MGTVVNNLTVYQDKCGACPHPNHDQRQCGTPWDGNTTRDWNSTCDCTEWRPGYILALRAQALDAVQDTIEAIGNRALPTTEQWELLKHRAFPPPPTA